MTNLDAYKASCLYACKESGAVLDALHSAMDLIKNELGQGEVTNKIAQALKEMEGYENGNCKEG